MKGFTAPATLRPELYETFLPARDDPYGGIQSKQVCRKYLSLSSAVLKDFTLVKRFTKCNNLPFGRRAKTFRCIIWYIHRRVHFCNFGLYSVDITGDRLWHISLTFHLSWRRRTAYHPPLLPVVSRNYTLNDCVTEWNTREIGNHTKRFIQMYHQVFLQHEQYVWNVGIDESSDMSEPASRLTGPSPSTSSFPLSPLQLRIVSEKYGW